MGAFDFITGGQPGAFKELERLANANFEDHRLQKYLPPSLRFGQTGDILKSGIAGIGNLIRNPGQLSPTVESAIRPRLAAESENIAGNFRGIQANQAGRAARTNLPVSIKSSLASALDVAQSRAQRGARREALTDSDKLRRADLGQTFNILQAIMQFLNSGRGFAGGALQGVGQEEQNRSAATMAMIGSLASSAGSFGGGGGTSTVTKG